MSYGDYNYDYDDDNLLSVSANVSQYKDQCLTSGAKQSFCKVRPSFNFFENEF